MRALAAPMLALIALAAAGCGASLSYTADFDPSIDFQQRSVWAWYPSPRERDRRVDNDILDSRIRHLVGAKLTSLGYPAASEDAPPQLWLNYYLVTQERARVQSTNTFYNYANVGWGYSVYYPSTVQTTVREYTMGTLILDVIDPSTRQLIWRGTATTELDGSRSTDERHAILEEAIAGILSRLPPH